VLEFRVDPVNPTKDIEVFRPYPDVDDYLLGWIEDKQKFVNYPEEYLYPKELREIADKIDELNQTDRG